MGHLFNQITNLDNLSQAWDEVVDGKSKPGSDGESLEDFAHEWEANMVTLRQAVRANLYRPAPLARFTIPKRDGSPRLLGKLTIRDKILQRSALQVLDAAYEKSFLNCSYAYRPGRSVQQAVERVSRARDQGRGWVLHADIDDFFHKLNHPLLFRFLRETINDEPLLQLLAAWLKVGRPNPAQAEGTPLGAVVSPLLSNVYLHYLDLVMTHSLPDFGAPPAETGRFWADLRRSLSLDWVYVRYSDDFVVVCRSEEQAKVAWQWVEETLSSLRLHLNSQKTAITTFKQGFTYLGCHFKGDSFYVERQGKRIKVASDGDWNLFYTYGPEGYE